MTERLRTEELVRLVRTVFRPRDDDRSMALMVDLPDDRIADHPEWATRRELAADWHGRLLGARAELGLDTVDLVSYRNVGSNNADLPLAAWVHEAGPAPDHVARVAGDSVPLDDILRGHRLLLVLTEFSATAPMKLNAPRCGFRAATMPGFSQEMIPALRLDYGRIDERCRRLKARLDEASGARVQWEAAGRQGTLVLDLRHRRATASGGLVTEPGTAGNLPSGETYIVPYEGEHEDDPSRTEGLLPLELDQELIFYRIEGNRVVEVIGDGEVAAHERNRVEAEPAYANLAELGLGLLAEYGIRPIGRLLLDEKLGLHIAFGRSDHFGGQVGAADFSSPDKVVHIDRVYLPELQPRVRVLAVDLELPDEEQIAARPLMRDGRYV